MSSRDVAEHVFDERPQGREHLECYSSSAPSSPEKDDPSNYRAPAPSSMPQKANEFSEPSSCSIFTWVTTATDDGTERQPTTTTNCKRRSLVNSGDLRDEIARLLTKSNVSSAATAAAISSFVTTSSPEQPRPQPKQEPQQQAQRKPLITLHGLPEPFLSALIESPLDIDPVFAEAHAERRRYRPRGAYRRRRDTGAVTAAHWDYPELSSGYRQALEQREGGFSIKDWSGAAGPLGRGTAAARPVGGGDLAAVFCRASLWGAEGVDVLFLDVPAWQLPGSRARGRSNGSVERNGVKRGLNEGRWQGVTPEKGGAINTLEGILQETIGAGDVDGALEDVLEETTYDHWLEFFEVLTPRRKAFVSDRMSLEWQAMEALERNTDMRNEIARRRKSSDIGSYPDWEGLTQRLRLRVEMLSTMPPLLRVPPAQSSNRKISIHEDNLADFPIARQPVPADNGSDPSSGANENQRALDRVTYLGGILLPFSIVSGVFSMNEDFLPGHAFFWVFWVVAVPLAVMAILVIYADKLRRAEVWVAVPVEVEGPDEEGSPVPEEKEHEMEKKGRKRQGFRPEPVPMVSIPEGRMHFSRPEAVTYSAAGEVVIDLGTPTATIEEFLAISAEPFPFPSPPPPPPMPDGEQDKPGQQAGQAIGLPIPEAVPTLHMPPNTNPIPTAGTNPGIGSDGSHHHDRRRKLRKQQLGWIGAVLCMLNLRKPSLVSEGEPAGATGRTRRQSRRKALSED